MKCKDSMELYQSYLENNIMPENNKELIQHISSCPECTKEIEFLNRYKNIINDINPIKAPDDFLIQLHSRLDEKPSLINKIKEYLSPENFKIPKEAFGTLIIAVLFFMIYNPFNKDSMEKDVTLIESDLPSFKVKEKYEDKIILPLGKSNTPEKKVSISKDKINSDIDNIVVKSIRKIDGDKKIISVERKVSTNKQLLNSGKGEETEDLAVRNEFVKQEKSETHFIVTYRSYKSPETIKDEPPKVKKRSRSYEASGMSENKVSAKYSPAYYRKRSQLVKKLIISKNGKIYKVKRDSSSGAIVEIHFTISLKNYNLLISSLGKTGDVKKSFSAINETDTYKLKVKIKIQN